MKYIIPFLVSMSLLAACETTNVYPTKVVEVQMVKTETPAPVVVTQTVTKIDCASIDPSFEQVGDTCVSICVECIKNGGQCIDTNKNGYGDTCVRPAPECPMMPYYQDLDGDGYGDLSTAKTLCSGIGQTGWIDIAGDCNVSDPSIHPDAKELCDNIDNNCDGETDEGYVLGTSCGNGVCAGVWMCSADKLGTVCPGISNSVQEVCADSLDNNCDGQTDEECVVAVDPSEIDADSDGYKALVDCNDNDASIHPGLDNCPTFTNLTKESLKLVLVWGGAANSPWKAGAYYKSAKSVDELQFSSKTFFDDTWEEKIFPQYHYTATDIDPKSSVVAFNVFGYPGYWYLCTGNVVDKVSVNLKKELPKVYLVSGGIWQEVSSKLSVLAANDLEVVNGPIYGGDYNKSKPAYCAALLNLK